MSPFWLLDNEAVSIDPDDKFLLRLEGKGAVTHQIFLQVYCVMGFGLLNLGWSFLYHQSSVYTPVYAIYNTMVYTIV